MAREAALLVDQHLVLLRRSQEQFGECREVIHLESGKRRLSRTAEYAELV